MSVTATPGEYPASGAPLLSSMNGAGISNAARPWASAKETLPSGPFAAASPSSWSSKEYVAAAALGGAAFILTSSLTVSLSTR